MAKIELHFHHSQNDKSAHIHSYQHEPLITKFIIRCMI